MASLWSMRWSAAHTIKFQGLLIRWSIVGGQWLSFAPASAPVCLNAYIETLPPAHICTNSICFAFSKWNLRGKGVLNKPSLFQTQPEGDRHR